MPLPIPSSSGMHAPVSRRGVLSHASSGLASVALSHMLNQGTAQGERMQHPLFRPRARSVIWYFMLGGTSHVESFDPKPALNQYAGKTIEESPHGESVLNSPFYRSNVRDFSGTPRALMKQIYPLQTGYRPRGESGIEISNWWPHVGGCADDLAIVRSMWTTDNDHAAQLQFHTGRHIFDGFYPSIGSWVHYGLGSLNDNLPQFLVMGPPPGDCCGGPGAHDGSYLGPQHSGVRLTVKPGEPLRFGTPGGSVTRSERLRQLELLQQLNSTATEEYPDESTLRARMDSYELAFRMQLSVPELVNLSEETQETHRLYGLDRPETATVARQSLVARRLVERGVRFVQIYDDGWDAHTKLKQNHAKRCQAVDRPIAALLTDLKRRGMLDETLVVWATEFGRTPGAEKSDGRDHHPYGFSVWMAGGGIRGGITVGATDELGFHAVEDRHYVTDIHATVMNQLGLDPRNLQVPGHKRLEIDLGQPIQSII